MKRTIIKLFIMLSFLLQGCEGQKPAREDIVGKWKSPDGAVFEFDKDGSFIAKSFPAEVVFHLDRQFTNIRFDGSGKWVLRKGDTHWEIYLDFQQVSNKECKSVFPLLISGENGTLENKPPWYLFVWKGEEGGERYIFKKQE
jgi:hypothetical protein